MSSGLVVRKKQRLAARGRAGSRRGEAGPSAAERYMEAQHRMRTLTTETALRRIGTYKRRKDDDGVFVAKTVVAALKVGGVLSADGRRQWAPAADLLQTSGELVQRALWEADPSRALPAPLAELLDSLGAKAPPATFPPHHVLHALHAWLVEFRRFNLAIQSQSGGAPPPASGKAKKKSSKKKAPSKGASVARFEPLEEPVPLTSQGDYASYVARVVDETQAAPAQPAKPGAPLASALGLGAPPLEAEAEQLQRAIDECRGEKAREEARVRELQGRLRLHSELGSTGDLERQSTMTPESIVVKRDMSNPPSEALDTTVLIRAPLTVQPIPEISTLCLPYTDPAAVPDAPRGNPPYMQSPPPAAHTVPTPPGRASESPAQHSSTSPGGDIPPQWTPAVGADVSRLILPASQSVAQLSPGAAVAAPDASRRNPASVPSPSPTAHIPHAPSTAPDVSRLNLPAPQSVPQHPSMAPGAAVPPQHTPSVAPDVSRLNLPAPHADPVPSGDSVEDAVRWLRERNRRMEGEGAEETRRLAREWEAAHWQRKRAEPTGERDDAACLREEVDRLRVAREREAAKVHELEAKYQAMRSAYSAMQRSLSPSRTHGSDPAQAHAHASVPAWFAPPPAAASPTYVPAAPAPPPAPACSDEVPEPSLRVPVLSPQHDRRRPVAAPPAPPAQPHPVQPHPVQPHPVQPAAHLRPADPIPEPGRPSSTTPLGITRHQYPQAEHEAYVSVNVGGARRPLTSPPAPEAAGTALREAVPGGGYVSQHSLADSDAEADECAPSESGMSLQTGVSLQTSICGWQDVQAQALSALAWQQNQCIVMCCNFLGIPPPRMPDAATQRVVDAALATADAFGGWDKAAPAAAGLTEAALKPALQAQHGVLLRLARLCERAGMDASDDPVLDAVLHANATPATPATPC